MNENINLVEILKDCPKGTKFYSSVYGELIYSNMYTDSLDPKIYFIDENNRSIIVGYYRDGRLYDTKGECTIFPSKDQRDWSKFTAPWLKKERDKDKLIQELGKYKVKYTQEVLEKYINSMSNKNNERLRKTTIAFLKDFAEQGYENAVECIDWLEKQNEQKSTDKIEPKFKVGDWIASNLSNSSNLLCIIGVDETNYKVVTPQGSTGVPSIRYIDKHYHLWTIEDAKDSDVLCCKSGWMCILKDINNQTKTFSSYCFMDSDKCFFNGGSECHTLDKKFIKSYNGEIHPATKEQHDLLFTKIKEAGYEWDFNKKKLIKIEDELENFKQQLMSEMTDLVKKYISRKIDWSEKDEHKIKDIVYFLETAKKHYASTVEIDACIEWLELLKKRIGG